MKQHCKYDIESFAVDLSLSLEDTADLYFELVKEMYLDISKLKSAYETEDFHTIQLIIHDLKGVSGNYKITDVFEATSQINILMRSKCYESINTHLQSLYSLCENAITEIKNYFNSFHIKM